MGELSDKAKGKVKETVGVVTGNRKLEGEGKVDAAKGKVKGAFEKLKRDVKEVFNSPKEHRPPRKP